ncbi:MAG: GHKL domain-containing protein [Lachnospiraceae bacterium]|nr:GHKL domain-containing protein [Lachnospiraceae bacterium]
METILRCLLLSFMLGTSCQLFYETIVPQRKWQHPWIEYTMIPAFTAGGMIIAFTEIPPYILQPVRLIMMAALIAQIYFQMRITKNLILSVLFCAIYWSVSTAVLSVFHLFLDIGHANESIYKTTENLTELCNLCLMIAFHHHFKSRIRGLTNSPWKKFGIFPLLFLIIIMALNIIPGDETASDKYARLAAVSGFAILSILVFYFAMRMLEKETILQQLQMRAERTRNQMNMYHSMQMYYEQQRRFLHDYKNQLNCIQGLLDRGETQAASNYIMRITGNLRAQFGDINTNHTVVNIILNQKYQTACDKNITMTFVMNDLSKLTMPEEDLVTLLANLLDNAIEACEKLNEETLAAGKIIQFKMVLEEDQLILSVRNPVNIPIQIKNNQIVTSKKESAYHGIGLSNVDSVVKKYGGTSILKCEDGWFSFSAILLEPAFFAV